MQSRLPIVALSQCIQQLNLSIQEIQEGTSETIVSITNEAKFTNDDNREFQDLLNQIKQDNLRKIAQFYQMKIHDKTRTFQTEIDNFGKDSSEIQNQIHEMQLNLKDCIENMGERKKNKQHLIAKLVVNIDKNRLQGKVFNALKNYHLYKIKSRKSTAYVKGRYQSKLLAKCFFPWRAMSYKTGYQQKLISHAEKDIKNVQNHFLDIIKILRAKIAETDDLITIKKNAKAEFTYSLSKNLLKTISNLSMEVLQLNQTTIKDNTIENDDSAKFLKELNGVVNKKMNDVQEIRNKLQGNKQGSSDKKKHRQTISFDIK